MWAWRLFARSPAAVGLILRFLFIGSRLCSTLLSDPVSRRRPCASLSLLLHQDGKRTFTSKLSNMLGTRKPPLKLRFKGAPDFGFSEMARSPGHPPTTPLRFAIPSPPSGWEEDFHLQAVEHARHTKTPAQASLQGGTRLWIF